MCVLHSLYVYFKSRGKINKLLARVMAVCLVFILFWLKPEQICMYSWTPMCACAHTDSRKLILSQFSYTTHLSGLQLCVLHCVRGN